jgi:hypothetical protein
MVLGSASGVSIRGIWLGYKNFAIVIVGSTFGYPVLKPKQL